MVVIYFGSFSTIVGLFGTVMQVFILMADRYYRQTPCTFYFIVAAIHECGIFTTAYGQLVASALIRTDLGQLSIVWCIDRQLIIVVFIQILLTIVGLAPYGISRIFLLIRLNFQKTADEEVKETLASNITYLFSVVAYGGRFYLLMCSSSRFRRMAKKLWLCGQRQGRIVPTI
ncbi:unnamed protein product [Rotaria socialis]